MGAGASAEKKYAVDINAELAKPANGEDVTASPDMAVKEVQRLRGLLADLVAKENTSDVHDLLHGHSEGEIGLAHEHTEHRERIAKRKLRKNRSVVKDIPEEHKEALRSIGKPGPSAAASNEVGRGLERSESMLRRWIKDVHMDEVAVLVSDLHGFTSTTRKYGIIHFASIIMRMRQLVLPILNHYGATFISTEADNFIVIFSDVVKAACAAIEFKNILSSYNATLAEDHSHFAVQLNGIGLHCGKDVIIDLEGKLHGHVASTAYHIGEDICSSGNLLITNDVFERLKGKNEFSTVQFADITSDDDLQLKSIEGSIDGMATLVPVTDLTFLPPQLELFVKRHDPSIDVKPIDALIAQKFQMQYTALMYELDCDEDSEEASAQHSIILKTTSLSLCRPILKSHGGIELEDVLFIFSNSQDALSAALEMRARIAEYNKAQSETTKEFIKVTGWGIHMGTMIFVEGTDIHWGDPVNTASKLGQDLAKNGDILITPSVYHGCKDGAKFKSTEFDNVMLKRSGVDFLAYSVNAKDKLDNDSENNVDNENNAGGEKGIPVSA